MNKLTKEEIEAAKRKEDLEREAEDKAFAEGELDPVVSANELVEALQRPYKAHRMVPDPMPTPQKINVKVAAQNELDIENADKAALAKTKELLDSINAQKAAFRKEVDLEKEIAEARAKHDAEFEADRVKIEADRVDYDADLEADRVKLEDENK